MQRGDSERNTSKPSGILGADFKNYVHNKDKSL